MMSMEYFRSQNLIKSGLRQAKKTALSAHVLSRNLALFIRFSSNSSVWQQGDFKTLYNTSGWLFLLAFLTLLKASFIFQKTAEIRQKNEGK